jgi:CRP-like cAMP-binding protein
LKFSKGEIMMDNLFALLQRCSLFTNKSIDEIQTLLGKIHYRIQLFKENEIIFSANDFADTMGIILSGVVDVQKVFPSGKIVTVTTRSNFDLLADASMFAKTTYYPSTISACKTSRILLIPKRELLTLFALDQAIVFNFLESVSNRILALNQKIETLSLTSIQEKIAYFLLTEYENKGSTILTLPFSKKSWAEHLNVSRPSLSRELKQLETAGLLSVDKRTIEIKHPEKLKELLF